MRRRRTTKRELIPDVKYNSELVARLINTLMKCGKKSIAQKIVYGAFDYIATQKKDMEPLEVFIQAVENVKPKVEVKSRRVGGANYQAHRRRAGTPGRSRHPLDHDLFPGQEGQTHDDRPRHGTPRRFRQHRLLREEKR